VGGALTIVSFANCFLALVDPAGSGYAARLKIRSGGMRAFSAFVQGQKRTLISGRVKS